MCSTAAPYTHTCHSSMPAANVWGMACATKIRHRLGDKHALLQPYHAMRLSSSMVVAVASSLSGCRLATVSPWLALAARL